jgi:hypothetical protein
MRLRRSVLALLVAAPLIAALLLVLRPASPPGGGGFVGEYIPDATTIADCAGDPAADANCWYQAFANLAYREGVAPAFTELRAAISTIEGANRNCHISTHGIGAGGLRRADDDLARAVVGGSDLCGGFYHGVLIGSMRDIPLDDVGASAALILDRCLDAAAFPARDARENCVHGAGHALMVRGDNDLPAMLAICDRVEERELGMGYYCGLGVTMENFISSWGLERRWLRADDPVYPCNVLPAQHKAACYGVVSQLHIQLVGTDPDRLGELCRRAEPAWAPYCVRQAYVDISPQEWREPDRIVARCERISPYERPCIWGAVSGLAVRDESAAALSLAASFCSRLPDGPLGEACAYAVGQNMSGVADMDERCASFDDRPALARWCRTPFPAEAMRDLGIYIHTTTGAVR